MKEQEKKGFTGKNVKKLLIIDLFILIIVFVVDIILSFMPIMKLGIYHSGNAWNTVIDYIKEIGEKTTFLNGKLFFLALIICGNVITSIIMLCGNAMVFSFNLNTLKDLTNNNYGEGFINGEAQKNKKETRVNFIIDMVFWTIIFIVELIFVIYAVKYYKIVSFGVWVSVLITATGIISSIVVSFIKKYSFFKVLYENSTNGNDCEKVKKHKPVFKAIDMAGSLIVVILIGLGCYYNFQIKMIGKPYTDFKVNYSSEKLDINNNTFDIVNYNYLEVYDLAIYNIINNVYKTHTTVVYADNYNYLSQIMEHLGDNIDNEKQEIMLKIARDIGEGKIATDALNNAVLEADLKIKELTNNYEKTKEKLNGVIDKMRNRAVIVKTGEYAYEMQNKYMTGDKWLGGGSKIVSGEAVISLFYDNDVAHSGEKWDNKGKIVLSRTVFQSGIEFKVRVSALIYYSDGSISNSMFIPDNIDELNNHPIGEAEIKWHDEYGSYSSTIYFDDLLSKLGDLS